MARRRLIYSVIVPCAVMLAGVLWLNIATEYFERQTGRAFYGLAGQHYSHPEWGFEYHAGGQHIEQWSVTVPSMVTLLALFVSAVVSTIAFRRDGLLWIAVAWWDHVGVATGYVLIATWFWFNVVGVFI
jgi:hypothetical protein